MKTKKQLIENYDELAEEYARTFCSELDGKPFDRNLLQRFSAMIPRGVVCDLGCGPGHVADYMRSFGLDCMGVDLSPNMVAEAKRRYPSIEYRVGDMLDLDFESDSLAGIIAFYSIIHLERRQLDSVFREFLRVLKPEGKLLISFHRGHGTHHEDEALGKPVSFDCTLFEPDDVSGALENAGLGVVEVTVRRAYDFEFPTRRVYVLAEKGIIAEKVTVGD